MQFARLNGITMHYQVLPAAAPRPRLVFVNSLGTDFRIWQDVVAGLAGECGVLLYDQRGHGLSGLGTPPYDIGLLAGDLAALMGHAGFGPAIVCGLSVGGLIAQELCRARPDLVRGLVLCSTLARIGTAEFWAERTAAVRAGGIAAVSGRVLAGWFTEAFRRERTPEYEGYRNMLERTPLEGYLGTVAAIRDADLAAAAARIGVPVLCLAGEADPTTTPAAMAAFARSIPGARFEVIPGAGHIPGVEQPDRLGAIIRAFTDTAGAAHAA